MNFEYDASTPRRDDRSESFFVARTDGRVTDAELVNAEIASDDSDLVRLSFGGMLSWLLIVTITAGMMLLVAANSVPPESETAPETSAAQLLQIQMQGKMIVAQQQLQKMAAGGMEKAKVVEDADAAGEDKPADVGEITEPVVAEEAQPATDQLLPPVLNRGPYAQRIAYAILLNEIAGSEAALESLTETDQRLADSGLKLTENQKRLRSTVGGLLESYANEDWAAANVDEADKEWLSENMNWIGELVQAPSTPDATELRQNVEGEALVTFVKLAIGMVVGLLAGVCGLVIAVILVVMLSSGSLGRRFEHRSSRQNIYAETFAIWMTVFFAGQILLGTLLKALEMDSGAVGLALTPMIFFVSLIALAWPVFRGISISEVRLDIGWRGNLIVESALGVLAYLAMLPAVALAFLVVVILMTTFASTSSPEDFSNAGGPSHPIQEFIMQGDLPVIGLVFLAACVAAPIVEETMFRGVLYRHFRDWTAGWRVGVSIFVSCVVGSFVFAAIHPQGIYGVPLLMTLATGFSLVREWRGSLWASITMHAINNGVVILVMLLVL